MSSDLAQNALSTEMLQSRQAAIKNRIITHLNADHRFSLEIYLRHFCAVPQTQAASAKITDITTEHMIIESGAGRNLIAIDPPMKSLAEAREKTILMHNEALAGLGLSTTIIDVYAPPNKPWQIFTCLIVCLCLVTFPFRSKLLPASGSIAYQIWSVGGLVPQLAYLAYHLGPLALFVIAIIHTLEAENFARTRLRKHQVPIGSPIWCLWTVQAFIGGVACFSRFDNLVKEKEESKNGDQKS